jgi:putative ABC transport system permease protein
MHPTVTVTAAAHAHEFERPRRMAALAASIAGVGLLLSIVGVFGVTAYAVGTRMREVGIRIALGARRTDVTRLFVRDGLRPVLIGLLAGFVVALTASHAVAGLLFGLSDRDPVAFTAAMLIILGAALAATVVPTRRAARLDPAAVLRDI